MPVVQINGHRLIGISLVQLAGQTDCPVIFPPAVCQHRFDNFRIFSVTVFHPERNHIPCSVKMNNLWLQPGFFVFFNFFSLQIQIIADKITFAYFRRFFRGINIRHNQLFVIDFYKQRFFSVLLIFLFQKFPILFIHNQTRNEFIFLYFII